MKEEVSTETLLTYGYFTRDMSRIITDDSNLRIEDMCAYASFDAGIATLDAYCIPMPNDAKLFSVQAKEDEHLRNEWLRVAQDYEDLDRAVDRLIHMWDELHGPLTVIKAIPLAGYYVFERGAETGRDVKGRGILAFLDNADYEAPEMTHERLHLACTIISRFVPGVTIQFYSPTLKRKVMVKAPVPVSEKPMNIVMAAIAQVQCKVSGTGLRERIQSPEAHDLAMWHAWKTFIIEEARTGVLDLTEWQIRNAISLLAEFSNFLQPKYQAVVSTTDGITGNDNSVLKANIRAAVALNNFHNANQKVKWLPLAAHWRMASKTNDWTLTVLPDYNRIEYVMSRSKLNLGGLGVNVLYPSMTGNSMSMVYPDYAVDPVIKTYYRTTRPWTHMVSVDPAFIDPSVILTSPKHEEEFIKCFNDARLAITDMLSSKAFIRGARTFRDPKDKDKGIIGKLGGNNGPCAPPNDINVIERASRALLPVLKTALGTEFDYVIPMNGQVMDSLGEFRGRRMIVGYAIKINATEDSVLSRTVALRWDDSIKRFLSYGYQEQEEDFGLGIYAR